MTARILLIRHGRSAHDDQGRWVSAAGFRQWRVASDAVGIRSDQVPPAGLVAAVGLAGMIVSSDLPRALASAALLAPTRDVEVSSQFREADLEVPALPLLLPTPAWDVLVHLYWAYRILRRTDASPDLRRRVQEAAQWLDARARASGHVAVITHGVFRRLLVRPLIASGWRMRTRLRSYTYWSVWTLSLGAHSRMQRETRSKGSDTVAGWCCAPDDRRGGAGRHGDRR